MGFTFNAGTGRYHDATTGRMVSEASIRDAVDLLADAASARIAAATARLQAGTMTLSEWQTEMMATTKAAHVAAGIAAHGGRESMTSSDWGYIGSRIKPEYAYLRDLANGIADGSIPLDGRLTARAAMYGQAARTTFGAVTARDQAGRGFVSERNILGASEHSCAACVSESGRGWVLIGTLSLPGTRTCLGNCHCRLAYSAVAADAAA